MKPVIFLDFDGVLNSTRSARAFGGYDSDQLDPVAIKLVEKLAEMADAYVVVSSSWRLLYALEVLKDILAAYSRPFSNRVIGVTPSLRSEGRGEEIEAWLTDNGNPHYVILDDDASDLLPEQFSNFVEVDHQYGFSACDYEEALNVLGFEEPQGDL